MLRSSFGRKSTVNSSAARRNKSQRPIAGQNLSTNDRPRHERPIGTMKPKPSARVTAWERLTLSSCHLFAADPAGPSLVYPDRLPGAGIERDCGNAPDFCDNPQAGLP